MKNTAVVVRRRWTPPELVGNNRELIYPQQYFLGGLLRGIGKVASRIAKPLASIALPALGNMLLPGIGGQLGGGVASALFGGGQTSAQPQMAAQGLPNGMDMMGMLSQLMSQGRPAPATASSMGGGYKTGGRLPIDEEGRIQRIGRGRHSDAIQFNGPTHEEGGILLSDDVEVEGGETMDRAQGGQYVFSNSLIIPGTNRTFSEAHRALVLNNRSQQAIDSLAAYQERVSGRDDSRGRPVGALLAREAAADADAMAQNERASLSHDALNVARGLRAGPTPLLPAPRAGLAPMMDGPAPEASAAPVAALAPPAGLSAPRQTAPGRRARRPNPVTPGAERSDMETPTPAGSGLPSYITTPARSDTFGTRYPTSLEGGPPTRFLNNEIPAPSSRRRPPGTTPPARTTRRSSGEVEREMSNSRFSWAERNLIPAALSDDSSEYERLRRERSSARRRERPAREEERGRRRDVERNMERAIYSSNSDVVFEAMGRLNAQQRDEVDRRRRQLGRMRYRNGGLLPKKFNLGGTIGRIAGGVGSFLRRNAGDIMEYAPAALAGIQALRPAQQITPRTVHAQRMSERALDPIRGMQTEVDVDPELRRNDSAQRALLSQPGVSTAALLAGQAQGLENTGRVMSDKRNMESQLKNNQSQLMSSTLSGIDSANMNAQSRADEINSQNQSNADYANMQLRMDRSDRLTNALREGIGVRSAQQERRDMQNMEPMQLAIALHNMPEAERNRYLETMANSAPERYREVLMNLRTQMPPGASGTVNPTTQAAGGTPLAASSTGGGYPPLNRGWPNMAPPPMFGNRVVPRYPSIYGG